MPSCILIAATALALCLVSPALAQKPDAPAAPASAALVKAADGDDAAAAERALAAGADPNAADTDGLTALNWAAFRGNAAIVRALLARHANVDPQTNSGGWTPLMNAANGGHDDVITALLDAGAKVDAKGAEGFSAIWFAAMGDHRKTVALLRSRGATADVSAILLAQSLCTAARGPMEDDMIVWAPQGDHPGVASCDGLKHIFPGGEGAVIMFTFQVTGDGNGARSVSIKTHIAANQLSKDKVAATLRPLLTELYVASGRGPAPAPVLSAASDLAGLQTDTPLGALNARLIPGDDPQYPVIGTEYLITINLK